MYFQLFSNSSGRRNRIRSCSKFRQTGIQVRTVLARTENVRFFGPASHFGVQFRQPSRFKRPRTLRHEEIVQHRSKSIHLSPKLFQRCRLFPATAELMNSLPWAPCNESKEFFCAPPSTKGITFIIRVAGIVPLRNPFETVLQFSG